MSTQYTPSEISRAPYSSFLVGLIGTAFLFALLPILQVIPNLFVDAPAIDNIDTVHDNPPIVFDPPKPEPPKKKELKKPELERPLEKIPIEKLPDLFRVGSSSVTYQLGGNYTEFIETGDIEEIFELRDLDRTPKAVFQVEPQYPYELKQAKIKGWVLLEWIITESGSVKGAKVIQSSHDAFNRPAIDSVLKSKWMPGEISGKAVPTRVRQKIMFNP